MPQVSSPNVCNRIKTDTEATQCLTIQVFSNDKTDVMYICLSSSVKCDGTPGKLVSENIRLLAASKAKEKQSPFLPKDVYELTKIRAR